MSLVLLLTSWVTLVLAEINAAYLLEVNAATMVGLRPPTWLPFLFEEHRLVNGLLTIETELLPWYLLYWAPLVGIMLAHRSKLSQSLIVLSLVVLLLLDLRQLFMFEGGGRKGCEFCFVWWIFHACAGAVALVVGGGAALWRGAHSDKNPTADQ